MTDEAAVRGFANSPMRKAKCKDCLREERAGKLGVSGEDLPEDFDKEFTYNENAAQVKIERGQTRSDRCKRHRGAHRINIQGMAVPYIDLQTIGTAIGANSPEGPTGPFGGLGPMPSVHEMAASEAVDLGKFGFGMDEDHIREILSNLANDETRICVVKAGTGTGKSTYMPYRLLDPPQDAAIRLADLGPIIVTEPRVQATTGVADFVGATMSGAGGVGPGYPVGYQVAGDRAHDDSCQLIYVTDGTMINWLREGRLSTIGTVIVDEAHERSTNIDFIMGYLKKAIDRYPHLRVIITSATFDERFYQEFFGGPSKVSIVDVPAVKTIGYGFPLFPDLDGYDGGSVAEDWKNLFGKDLALHPGGLAPAEFVSTHFAEFAPALKENEVAADNPGDIGYVENLHETTRRLFPLRFQGFVPEDQWREKMPQVLAEYIVELVRGLDAADVYGDILGFLPTGKVIDEAVALIREGLGITGAENDCATVYALLSSLDKDLKVKALAAQGKGDKRKIVISTNLAETSLTVEGVRFVVDTGLIAQSEWNPTLAQGGIPTKQHSQAGIRQRWGRVGRKGPGWVFPLYTKEQFLALPQDTPPGSARENLENLIMTAKLGGIDDVVGFDWPAKFLPDPETGIVLDESALAAREVFLSELVRADQALRTSGAVDPTGDPTAFGKELARAPGLTSAASKIAIMHADRLACVPEVVTILHLLDGNSLVGAKGLLLDAEEWPDEWRLEAAERRRALATGCSDDAELVLQVMAVWERCALGTPPWEESEERALWARRWWINDDLLRECAKVRREILQALSPAMKEEVKRFVEPALVRRSRGAITRAMSSLAYRHVGGGRYQGEGDDPTTGVIGHGLLEIAPDQLIPLKRNQPAGKDDAYLSNLVTLEPWALPPALVDGETLTGAGHAMQLLVSASVHGRPDTSKDLLSQLQTAWPAGLRAVFRLEERNGIHYIAGTPTQTVAPAEKPVDDVRRAADLGEEADADGPAGARAEDASPELDTKWPTLADMEPDDAYLAVRAVVDAEAEEIDRLACRSCAACRTGNVDECTDKYVPVASENVYDELAAWRGRSSNNLDVQQPRVRSADDSPLRDGAAYEIVGYDTMSDVPTLLLRSDWRAAGTVYRPAMHPTLTPGKLVEVVVGPMLPGDSHGDFRAFLHPASGGRFILRESSAHPDRQAKARILATSLTRRSTGLLEGLVEGSTLFGHVIPRAEPGCYRMTLLATLSAHWQNRLNRYERRDVALADGSTKKYNFYRAFVEGVPNPHGFAPVRSAIRDRISGISHLFSVFADPDDPVATAAAAIGATIEIQVRPEVARLDVGGRSVTAVQQVLAAFPAELFPPAPLGSQSDGQPLWDAGDRVPGGWHLGRNLPLPSKIVAQLVSLDSDSALWEEDCWLFWAQSHHLRTVRDDSFRLGAGVEVIELAADKEVLSGEDRSQLAGATIRAAEPTHWRGVMSNGAAVRLIDLLGAGTAFLDGGQLVATFDDEHAARVGGMSLAAALALPAAAVEVDASVVGRVLGSGRARLAEAQNAPGIWVHTFDKRSNSITVVGEHASVAAAVANLLKISSGTTGELVLPPDKNGLLIGTRGSIKDLLLEASGCTFANPIDRSPTWKVIGPTEQAVLAFFRLAAARVPGSRGTILSSLSARVTDLVSGVEVADPKSHLWASAPQVDVGVVISPTSRTPALETDELLRKVHQELRDRGATSAHLGDLPGEERSRAAAFVYGLGTAHALGEVQSLSEDGQSLAVAWPGPVDTPGLSMTAEYVDFIVSDWDASLREAASKLRLGHRVVVDISGAAPSTQGDVSYFFAGLATALGLQMRAEGQRLTIERS